MSREIGVRITNANNVDLAIAEAVLHKLGLKTNQLRMDFIDTYGYKDLVLFFQATVNSPINQSVKARIIGAIKKYGYCPVGFMIDDKLRSDIKEFMAVHQNKLKDRIKDGTKQVGVSGINALDGVKKNIAESNNDVDKGAGRTAHGLWNSLTSPVGSQRFNEGWDDLKDGSKQLGLGLFKLEIQTPVDALAMMGLAELDRLTTIIGLENIGRSLNAVEKVLLMNIFGGSILYDEIIIKEGYAGVINAGYDGDKWRITENQRALTRGNTIYMKNNPVGSDTWRSTLVHETTHVWQNQNGGTDYMSEALYAQMFGDGYNFEKGIGQGKTWSLLNPEQQAKLIQDAYDSGFLQNGKPTGKWIDPNTGRYRPDFEQYFIRQNILGQLRSGQGAT